MRERLLRGRLPEITAGALSLVAALVLLSDRPILVAGAFAVPMTIAAFAKPVLALAAMAAFIPLEGFASLVPGNFTLPRLIGLVAFACFLGNALLYRKGLAVGASTRWFAAFVAWGFLSGFWAADATAAYTIVFVLFQLLLFYVMAANLLDSPASLRLTLGAYVAGAAVAALWGMRNHADHSFATNLERVSAVENMNPNDFARMLGFGMLCALYVAFDSGSKWVRQAAVTALPVLFVGLVLSKSRGAWMAFAASLAVLFLFSKKTPRIYAAAALVMFLLGATVAAGFRLGTFDESLRERVEQTTDGNDPTAQRADIWKVGLQLFKANPVAGVGLGNFPVRFNEYLGSVHTDVFPGFDKDPHNVILSIAGETGITGLVCFAALLAIVVRHLRRAPQGLHRAMGAAVLSFTLVAGFSGSDHIRKWFWLALLMALLLAQRRPDARTGR